jgi:hypothetical protein
VEDLRPFVADANPRVRLYTEIKVESWNGQVILSAFVRFWRSAEYLFVETTYRVLPPLKIDYRRIDSMNPRPTLRQLFQRILLPSALQVPLCSLQAPLGVVRGATLRIARARREHLTMQAIRENRLFNYGAERTVRESGSGRRYSTYFQWLDVERFTKVIDRHLLDTIRFFLEEKGVDVGELRLRMRSIFGTGVMVEGELNARDIQTGDGPDIDGP